MRPRSGLWAALATCCLWPLRDQPNQLVNEAGEFVAIAVWAIGQVVADEI